MGQRLVHEFVSCALVVGNSSHEASAHPANQVAARRAGSAFCVAENDTNFREKTGREGDIQGDRVEPRHTAKTPWAQGGWYILCCGYRSGGAMEIKQFAMNF